MIRYHRVPPIFWKNLPLLITREMSKSTLAMYDPVMSLVDKELDHILMSYCTLISLINGKKTSFQNVFLLTLKTPIYRDFLMSLTGLENLYEIVQLFVQYDNTICKSKHITKFINTLKTPMQ